MEICCDVTVLEPVAHRIHAASDSFPPREFYFSNSIYIFFLIFAAVFHKKPSAFAQLLLFICLI